MMLPQDVDLVVMSRDHDTETLKEMIVQKDRDFFLRDSRQLEATHRILYCRVGSGGERLCKVDILTPGIMNIPIVPDDRMGRWTFEGKSLFSMPIIPLLLLKLQAWEDHGASDRWEVRAKQSTDVEDINTLVNSAKQRGDRLASDSHWLPLKFIQEGKRRSRILRPNSNVRAWQTLGFPVDDDYY